MKNSSVGICTMASTQSLSKKYLRILLSPLPASPLKRVEPLWTTMLRPSSANLCNICCVNRNCPSLMEGKSTNLCVVSLRISFSYPFQSTPYGGLATITLNDLSQNLPISVRVLPYSMAVSFLKRLSIFAKAYKVPFHSCPYVAVGRFG